MTRILQEENKWHIFVTICFINCDGLFARVGANLRVRPVFYYVFARYFIMCCTVFYYMFALYFITCSHNILLHVTHFIAADTHRDRNTLGQTRREASEKLRNTHTETQVRSFVIGSRI